MPYREAFKKFETFFRKFKNNITDPDHVGPLININATKGESWKGPKEELQKFFMQSILNSLVQ